MAEAADIRNHVLSLRRQCGLSRKELAGEVGINHRTVGYIERQDYDPSLSLAYTMADCLDVEPRELFYRASESRGKPTSRRSQQWIPSVEEDLPPARRIFDHHLPDKVLTAILDTGGAKATTLEDMVGLTPGEASSAISGLLTSDLIHEDIEPGLLFGRPARTLYRPTQDGRKAVAIMHR